MSERNGGALVAHIGCGCRTGHECDRQRLLDHGVMAMTVYSARPLEHVVRDVYAQLGVSAHLLRIGLTEPVASEEATTDRHGGRTVTVQCGTYDAHAKARLLPGSEPS